MAYSERISRQGASETLDLESRITLALETAPLVVVPEGFTARVTSRVPAMSPPQLPPRTRYGFKVMSACVVILAALVLASISAVGRGSEAWLLAQLIFSAQLICVCLWLSLSPGGLISGRRSTD